MRELTRIGMQSRTLMDWVLRIMANLLRPDELGPAEAVYRSVAVLARAARAEGVEIVGEARVRTIVCSPRRVGDVRADIHDLRNEPWIASRVLAGK